LLVDYKVIVLAMDEAHVNRRLQKLLADDENNQLKVDDAAKIIGCWKALSKQGTQEDLVDDHEPMKRAVAFCQVIEVARAPRLTRSAPRRSPACSARWLRPIKSQRPEDETAA
jgi:predicted helicase